MSRENDLRQKILIVDDSEMNRAILSEMLNDDYDIEEAENLRYEVCHNADVKKTIQFGKEFC